MRICVRKMIILCFLFFTVGATYAQNGVSLEDVRANPYFQNATDDENSQSSSAAEPSLEQTPVLSEQESVSSQTQGSPQEVQVIPTQPQAPFLPDTAPLSPQESQNQKQSTQYKNPAESSSFYNSANWQDAGNSDFSYPNENAQSSANRNSSANSTPYKTGDPLLTDAEKRGKFPWLPLDESNFIVNIFYNPNYILSFASEDLAYYFNLSKFYNFELIGAGFKAQYLFAKTPHFALGSGFCASWNFLRNAQPYYVLSAHQILALLNFGANFLLGDYFLFELHTNAGILTLFDLEFEYVSGAKSENKFWIYPNFGAGFECDFYFSRNWSLGFGGDFNWPLLIEKPYPIIQIKLNSGWRF